MLILLSNLIRQHFRPFNKTSYLAGVQKSSWLVFGPASNSSLNGFSKEYVLMFHPEEQSVSVKKFTGQPAQKIYDPMVRGYDARVRL